MEFRSNSFGGRDAIKGAQIVGRTKSIKGGLWAPHIKIRTQGFESWKRLKGDYSTEESAMNAIVQHFS